MIAYLLRRLLYAVPLLIGVNLLTFLLFFVVNSPDDMARMQLGQKHVTEEAVAKWKHERGYDLPLFWNDGQAGLEKLEKTIFFEKSVRLMRFDFGSSDNGRDIGADIGERFWPSLAISLPALLAGLLTNITLALGVVFLRQSALEFTAMIGCVALMSVSPLFYIIGGQFCSPACCNWCPFPAGTAGRTASAS
jgi:peptide/nickel transport system permease protein